MYSMLFPTVSVLGILGGILWARQWALPHVQAYFFSNNKWKRYAYHESERLYVRNDYRRDYKVCKGKFHVTKFFDEEN